MIHEELFTKKRDDKSNVINKSYLIAFIHIREKGILWLSEQLNVEYVSAPMRVMIFCWIGGWVVCAVPQKIIWRACIQFSSVVEKCNID